MKPGTSFRGPALMFLSAVRLRVDPLVPVGRFEVARPDWKEA
jgi:hypothetical protein